MGPPPVAFAGISRLRPQGAPLRSAESLDPYVYVHIGPAAHRLCEATPRAAAVAKEVADEGLLVEELEERRGGDGSNAGRPEAGASTGGRAAIAPSTYQPTWLIRLITCLLQAVATGTLAGAAGTRGRSFYPLDQEMIDCSACTIHSCAHMRKHTRADMHTCTTN